MAEIELKAYAKVNISLDVLRRMENGYHQVKMIMQTVSLHDSIFLETCEEPGVFLQVDKDGLGKPEDNLAFKAASLLIEKCQIQKGIRIRLQKNIPIAAGLAGGSSDAAAVLRGISKLFQLGLDRQALMDYGVKLGADVPYCIAGGTYLAEGIGEKLTPAPKMPDCFILLVKPDIQVSTKWVYENLHANELHTHPDIEGMLADMKQGSITQLAARMGNVLENVTIPQYPIIQTIQTHLEKLGALKAMMSGSGPTVFAIFQTEEQMHQAYKTMQNSDIKLELFETTLVSAYE